MPPLRCCVGRSRLEHALQMLYHRTSGWHTGTQHNGTWVQARTCGLDGEVAEEAGGACPGPGRHVGQPLVQPVRLQGLGLMSAAFKGFERQLLERPEAFN